MRLDLGSQFFVHKVWISAIYIEKGKGESLKAETTEAGDLESDASWGDQGSWSLCHHHHSHY
jgi:hypothetical protein